MAKKNAPELAGLGAGDTENYTTDVGVNAEKAEFERMFRESMNAAPGQWGEFEPDLMARQRAWWFICYPESMNPAMIDILNRLGAQVAVSPLHDGDRWPDGTPKKSHFHVIIYQPGKVTYATLAGLVSQLGGVRLEPVENLVGACRYLCHLDIQPDKIHGDRGKVRYSTGDVIALNGFDYFSYVKATQTQISQALGELYALVRQKNITAYSTFVDFIYTRCPEYEFVMSNPGVCRQLSEYIKSRYAVAHKDDETEALRRSVEAYQHEIDRLIGAGIQILQEGSDD